MINLREKSKRNHIKKKFGDEDSEIEPVKKQTEKKRVMKIKKHDEDSKWWLDILNTPDTTEQNNQSH